MHDLKKAIKGLVVMSEALEDVFKAFINNQVIYVSFFICGSCNNYKHSVGSQNVGQQSVQLVKKFK